MNRYSVVVSYVTDVEKKDESEALVDASLSVRYGVTAGTRHLSVSICNVEKVEAPKTEADLFPPRTLDEAIALSTIPPETLQPFVVPPVDVSPVTTGDDIPF